MSNASSPRILSVNSVSEDKMPSSLPSMASHSAGVSTSQVNNPPEVRHLLFFPYCCPFDFLSLLTHSLLSTNQEM